MKNKIIILSIVFLTCHIYAYTQSISNKDTIYYLLDTLKTPIADHMITIEKADPYKFYTINCPCLEGGNKPMFRVNVFKDEFIDEKKYSSLKFIKLVNLIDLVRKNDNDHFGDRFVIYFIEPVNELYIKHKAFFLGGHVVVTN